MATLEEMKARLWLADLRLWIWRWQTLSPEDRAIFYKQPEKPRVHKKRNRNYGLTKYEADVIVDAGPNVCEYFEEFVEIAEYLSEQIEDPTETNGYNLGPACAKFIINDLFAVVKRNHVFLEDISIPLAVTMLIDRRRRLITNKQIKEKFDQIFKRN